MARQPTVVAADNRQSRIIVGEMISTAKAGTILKSLPCVGSGCRVEYQ